MAIRVYNLALVGFGNVGKELVRLLLAKETELRRDYNIAWRLTGAASRRVGWVANANGLDPAALLNHNWPEPPAGRPPTNVREWLAESKADVLFEATSLDRRTGYPATDHLKAALEYGAHAISANKGPIVHAYGELSDLARAKNRRFLFESTVMDGTPIFSMFPYGLPAVELRGFRGILNSTTNVVLTEMEKGLSLDEAVKKAQEIGVAEGMRYKLVCRAERTAEGVRAAVGPERLPMSDPLALLEGTTSALRFDTDVFGLSIIEHKPGIIATAYGLFADFIRAVAI